MAILTVADQPAFFPEVTISGDALIGAIAAAQALAEGPQGANRKLERHVTVETLGLRGGLCYLKARPRLADLVSVKVRAVAIAQSDSWQRNTPASAAGVLSTPWQTITNYTLDESIGEISAAIVGWQGTPLSQAADVSIRVEYFTGLDFGSLFPSPQVLALKSALAGLLKSSLLRGAGLESFSLTDFYRVDFTSEEGSGLREHLEVFKQIANSY